MEREKRSLLGSGMIQGGVILTLAFLFAAAVPHVGPIALIVAPLPVLYFHTRLGRKNGLTVLAVSLTAAYVILSLARQSPNLAVLLMIGFTGVLLSEVLKRRFSVEKTFAISSLALFGCAAGFFLYYAVRSGVTPWRMVEIYVSGIVQENIKLYSQLNLSEEQIQLIRQSAPEIAAVFTGIFPAMTLAGFIFTVWFNLLVGRRLFQINALPFPDFGDLAAWKAPERLVWLLIAAGGMVMAPVEGFGLVGANILILCGVVYLFQGLAIASFFFREKRVPAMIRWLFYLLILIQQYMLILVAALGLFDMWVDFRKRIGRMKNVPA